MKTALLATVLFCTGFNVAVNAEVPPVYQLIAAKHGLSEEGLYGLALKASGRQSTYVPAPTPWPWTVRLCQASRCEIAYPETREAMEAVLVAGQAAHLTVYVGPLALRWDPTVLPLRAATQPRVTINEAARQLAAALRDTPQSPSVRTVPSQGRIARALPAKAARWAALIEKVAAEEQLPPRLVHAIVAAESSYNPTAISPKGAVGLMQLMPGTAERFGVPRDARHDPERNLRAGTRYLGWLLRYFNGDITLAIAGYNAGEHKVDRYGRRIPPYPETQHYVQRVVTYLTHTPNGVPKS